MKRKLSEGSVFMLPLRDNGFAVGVLARFSRTGICYGYFFGPRIDAEGEIDFSQLKPEKAILEGMFGDLELRRGGWKQVGEINNWDRVYWNLKPLSRIDEHAGRAWLSFYDDKLHCIKEHEITVEEAGKYPYDRMMGAGAVEIRLTNLIR